MPSQRPSHQNHLQGVLLSLEEREVSTRTVLNQFPRTLDDDDSSVDSPCPIFELTYNDDSSEEVRRLTNFSVREIGMLWMSVRAHVVRYWNVGRGRWSQFSVKDVLIMMLTVLKVGGTWNSLARIFMLGTPSSKPSPGSFA